MYLKTTWKHIRRSPYQALAAIMIMTFTFFVAATLLLAAGASQKILSYFEGKPQITAFFKDKVTDKDIGNMENALKNTGKVSSIKYVSKEEALAIYREQNKKDPLLLEMVSAEILPASLEISATNVSNLKDLYEFIKKQPNIEEVVFQKDVVDTLTSWTSGIRKIGLSLLIFLSLISVLIIVTVIGMKIAIRREEIEILHLVGASNWYIRWPFILEGMFYGVTGAMIAWSVTYLILWRTTPFLTSFLSGIPLLPVSPLIMFFLLITLCLGGAIIGIIGSLLALWRYLK